MDKLKCEKCGIEQIIPIHCGKPMHLEKIKGKQMLVCWMGPECGKQSVPEHHGKPMKITP